MKRSQPPIPPSRAAVDRANAMARALLRPTIPTPAWVTPQPHESTALPPWYDDAVPGCEDDPLCLTNPDAHEWHWSEIAHRPVCVECGCQATDEELAEDNAALEREMGAVPVEDTPS